uniref:Mechanosensitive ion channel family protein n=1 Tax=Ammonifex degensii TaxID=42838 RepID=A0A7C2INM4_9THEO
MFTWDAFSTAVTGWLLTSGVRILLVITGTFLLGRVLTAALKKLEKVLAGKAGGSLEQEKRIRTLIGLLKKIVWVTAVVVGFVVILSELGVDIKPIITAAGIGGLALGFGAQSLVRDLISGFFMLLEDQIRVGDVVVLNGTAGEVVDINLRTTVLRDLRGVVHIFPNGNINSVSNMTKDWSRYVIDVGVSYAEDVDYVMEVLREIGAGLSSDPEFGQYLLGPLEVLGVDDFAPSAVVIKVMITTVPLKQWYVGRELRRRIKKKFDELGIEIPLPHTTLAWGKASEPLLDQVFREQRERCGEDK